MALGEKTPTFEAHGHSLDDTVDDEPGVKAMLFHFDPEEHLVRSYQFTIDPRLSQPGVPDWVTHYHTFPPPIREALEGLYMTAVRSGMTPPAYRHAEEPVLPGRSHESSL